MIAISLPVFVKLQKSELFSIMNISIGFILFDDNTIVINIGFKNTFALLGVVLLRGQEGELIFPSSGSLLLLDGEFLKFFLDRASELLQEVQNLSDCI